MVQTCPDTHQVKTTWTKQYIIDPLIGVWFWKEKYFCNPHLKVWVLEIVLPMRQPAKVVPSLQVPCENEKVFKASSHSVTKNNIQRPQAMNGRQKHTVTLCVDSDNNLKVYVTFKIVTLLNALTPFFPPACPSDISFSHCLWVANIFWWLPLMYLQRNSMLWWWNKIFWSGSSQECYHARVLWVGDMAVLWLLFLCHQRGTFVFANVSEV